MSGPPFTMIKYSSELELLRAQNAWLSKEGEECRSRIAALEKSNERLYENEANHTEAYGMVCAERDRARGAMDRVMMVLFSIVPPVHGEGAIAPEETAQRVAACAEDTRTALKAAREALRFVSANCWQASRENIATYAQEAMEAADTALSKNT